jgi:hypothetical protein
MTPDSLIRAVDTVRIAGRVFADTAKWWPAVYAGLGSLCGALVGAVFNFFLNRRLEQRRVVEARRQFRWQTEQAAAKRVTDALLEFMASLGNVQHRIERTKEAIERSRRSGVKDGTVDAVGELLYVGEAVLQPSWQRLSAALTGFPGVWDALRTALRDLGDHWTRLYAAFDGILRTDRALREPDAAQRDSSLGGRLAELEDALGHCNTEVDQFMNACKSLFVKVVGDMQTRDEPTIVVDDHGTKRSRNAVSS